MVPIEILGLGGRLVNKSRRRDILADVISKNSPLYSA
jgi:hypothetical protein